MSREFRASPPDPLSRWRAEALASLALGPTEAFFILAATTALLFSRRKAVESSKFYIALIKASFLCFSITLSAGALLPLQHSVFYSQLSVTAQQLSFSTADHISRQAKPAKPKF
jgi:hypothetical protein